MSMRLLLCCVLALATGVLGPIAASVGSDAEARIRPYTNNPYYWQYKGQPVLLVGDFGELTLPQLLKVNAWVVVIPAAALIVALLVVLESAGL